MKMLLLSIIGIMAGCATQQQAPIATVSQVDLQKFMGTWYVIAAIPTPIETESYNATETYALEKDGTIATTFTFNKGSLDGKTITYRPRGYVMENSGNALWGMQFIWPIKAEYRIAYLNPDYSQTIIARNARDYVWIMARTPKISDTDYAKLTHFISDLGYDASKLRKVPHNAAAVD